MFIGNKKCRIYAACGVSQTPNKKKTKKEERKVMLKNTKSNSKKPASGYDRIEFYIDFVQVLLSAFMLGYVIGKQKREKEN